MNTFEFFYDDSVEDFVPEVKLHTINNNEWTREAVNDLTREIDLITLERLQEMGIENVE